MTTLMQASNQWAKRPADERFTSLTDLREAMRLSRQQSAAKVVSSRAIHVVPDEDHKGLQVYGANGTGYRPTHHAFGQLARLVQAPAAYLRTLPSELAADNLNYGFLKRDAEDVGVLVQKNGSNIFRAATGPQYGRIWNDTIVDNLIERFGNGIDGRFRVPGEFGKAVTVTKENTTIYGSDRDCFVFLADEQNRINMPDRRGGRTGSLARGFFVWNSEVGDKTMGIKTFLFDYVCCNRIVWGASEVSQFTIRHTASAPDKFLDLVTPALTSYVNSSMSKITVAIEDARSHRLGDAVDEFLAKRYGKNTVNELKAIHMAEEDRPIETRWDVITALTAKARNIQYQDDRVEMETEAGELLDA